MLLPLVLGLLAASVTLTPPAARADVTLDENRLRYQLFVGNERINVMGNAFWIRAAEQAWLLDYRAEHPEATQEQLVQQLAWYDNLLRQRGLYDGIEKPWYQVIAGTLQALTDAGIPVASGVTSALRSLMDATLGADLAEFTTTMDQITGAWQTYGNIQQFNTVVDAILQRVVSTADQDRTFGNARDAFFGALSRASVYNTAEQFLADPVLATWINTQAIIDLLQSGSASQEALLTLVRAEFGRIGVKLDELRNGQLATLFQTSGAHPVVENGQRGTAAAHAAAQAQARANEQLIEAARAGVTIVSTLAGFLDPKLGKQVALLGNAAVQIASAINKYLPTIAGLGIGQALTSLSTVVLTGNILGAVMTLLPLFVNAGPTPEQVILQEVQRLREDVQRLGQTMGDRFNRVERGLNTIYNDMMVQFDRVIDLLDGITGYLSQMGHTLVTLQSRLDELGARLWDALDAVQQRDLKEEINYAIGFQRRYNRPLPDADFIRAENRFQFYATTVSRDAVSTAPVQQYGRVGNLDIDPNLAGSELPRNLGYLTWLANYRFGYGIQPRTLPNAAVWSLAARAYARLIAENPAVAATIAPQPAVRGTGAELDALVRQLSQPAAGGTNGLFTQLVANYRAAAQGVSTALRTEHNAVLAGRAVNLFRDAWQPAPVPATPGTMETCWGGAPLTAVSTMGHSGLPQPVYSTLAGYRAGPGVPRLATCYSMDVRETHARVFNRNLHQYGAVDVTVQTRLRLSDSDPWRVVRSISAPAVWTGTLCTTYFISGETVCDDPLPTVTRNWDATYRARVQAVAPVLDNAVVDGIGALVTGYLRGEAQRYLDVVSAKLAQPSELRNTATALTGAATLLRAYTRMAFPRALDADDLMSGMLVGDRSIVSESPDGPMVSATYAVARVRFQPCAAGQTTGCTGADRLYQPLWQQPYLTEGLPAPAGVTLPGEPVGDALVSSAIARLTVLAERIQVHSQRIAAGEHVESLPLFEEVSARLSLAESITRL
ncbi:MAG TPA: hypothetical protein VGD67_09805 [Pseudonocardiaceae bacterium]